MTIETFIFGYIALGLLVLPVAARLAGGGSHESIPESRPAMERPGLRKCREERVQRGKVAVR